jgi:fructuronate reductase
MSRLSMATLVDARATIPSYDRSAPPRIVHLGVGAFARAHLGTYADDLAAKGWPATICGISLRSPTAEQQLQPQNGLYTVEERESSSTEPLRVVGALTSIATGPTAAVEAIAARDTTMVTLTVTEKAYDESSPVAALLADALARRHARALPPPVIAPLDNVLRGGSLLRSRVLAVARNDAPAVSWIEDEVPFVNSVVDRMVPATTDEDRQRISDALGLVDQAAVCAERHCSWVIEQHDGLPPLGDVGVEEVADIEPYERRKLWLLNAPHSALAYFGLLAGCATIAQAVAYPRVLAVVRAVVGDILQVAQFPVSSVSMCAEAFAADALRRFGNPLLGHTCVQVGADGSRKLPQRLLPIVDLALRQGAAVDRFALMVAAWICAAAGRPVQGTLLPTVEDPRSAELHAATDVNAVVRVALGDGANRHFAAAVAQALQTLERDGAAALDGAA